MFAINFRFIQWENPNFVYKIYIYYTVCVYSAIKLGKWQVKICKIKHFCSPQNQTNQPVNPFENDFAAFICNRFNGQMAELNRELLSVDSILSLLLLLFLIHFDGAAEECSNAFATMLLRATVFGKSIFITMDMMAIHIHTLHTQPYTTLYTKKKMSRLEAIS